MSVIQDSLNFTIDDSTSFDMLIEDSNEFLITILKRAVGIVKNELYFVYGPKGCGKTHLTNALYDEARRKNTNVLYLDLNIISACDSPEILDIEPDPIIILDNVDAIANNEEAEFYMFSFFNRWIDSQEGIFIATASQKPMDIPFIKKDLNTRFSHGITLQMSALDKQSSKLALQMKASKRGFTLTDKVASYIVEHCGSNMSGLMESLDTIDKASMQEKHNITIPFIKKCLLNAHNISDIEQ